MKPRMINGLPGVSRFIPAPSRSNPNTIKEFVRMTPDELEALRLVDYEGLLQEEAAKRMGISRGTVWRCLDSARRKVATMLVEGRELSITSETIATQDIERPSRKSVKRVAF